MNTLILFLDKVLSIQLELLIINLFYTGLIGAFFLLTRRHIIPIFKKQHFYSQELFVTFVVLFLIIILDMYFLPADLQFIPSDIQTAILLSLIGILLSVGLEISLGLIFKNKKQSSFFINSSAQNIPKKKIDFLLLIIFGIPILEEIVFRGFIISYLQIFEIPLVYVILISGIAYGVNHIFYGRVAVIQKIVTGIILGILFYLTGFSLFAPIITHIGSNTLILLIRYLRNNSQHKGIK